jgi:hypothetical protein
MGAAAGDRGENAKIKCETGRNLNAIGLNEHINDKHTSNVI